MTEKAGEIKIGRENFSNCIKAMEKEWLEKDGAISCEFSTAPEHLDIALLIDSSNRLATGKKSGRWTFSFCDTCEEHHKNRPIHVEIVSNQMQIWNDLDELNRKM